MTWAFCNGCAWKAAGAYCMPIIVPPCTPDSFGIIEACGCYSYFGFLLMIASMLALSDCLSFSRPICFH